MKFFWLVFGLIWVGGFGGIDGFKEFLIDNEVKVMVDVFYFFVVVMYGYVV